MRGFKLFLEGKRQDIENLQPDTVLSVFHGTGFDDAYKFCMNGVDAKSYHPRVYSNHTSGGKGLKFGLFVAPNLKTGFKFGSAVIKFKTTGRNLIDMYPVEMSKSDQWMKDKYPNSFRPTVTHRMLDNVIEPQALYIGLLSPRAIEKVYVQDKSMSREEFIAMIDEKDPKLKWKKSHFEPQEYQMSLEDFAKRIAERLGGDEQEIMNILKTVYGRSGRLSGIGTIPPTLLRRIEAQLKSRR